MFEPARKPRTGSRAVNPRDPFALSRLPLPSAILTRGGIIIAVNEKFAALLEAPSETFPGLPLALFIDPGTSLAHAQLFGQQVTAESVSIEWRLITARRRNVWSLISTSAFRDDDRDFICLQAIDIHESKMRQNALEHDRSRLQHALDG